MLVKYIGKSDIDFTNSNGEKIKGTNLFCIFEDTNVEGFRAEKFFLKEGITLPKEVKLNDIIDIMFNRKGKVEQIKYNK